MWNEIEKILLGKKIWNSIERIFGEFVENPIKSIKAMKIFCQMPILRMTHFANKFLLYDPRKARIKLLQSFSFDLRGNFGVFFMFLLLWFRSQVEEALKLKEKTLTNFKKYIF